MRAILTYHSIDETGSPISVAPQVFQRHCEFLAQGGVRVLSLDALLSAPPSEPAVALTFDDGFVNFLSHAAPVLSASGLPYTIFVATNHVGGRNNWGGRTQPGIPDLPLMSWSDLAALAGHGMSVGAHTRSHPDLTTLNDASLMDELAGSADDVEQHLGIRPLSFAYPFGAWNARVRRATGSVFTYSCTTRMGVLGAHDDAAALPRVDMYYLRTEHALETFGQPSFSAKVWAREQGRRLRTLVQRTRRTVA